ncbi:lipid A biosynthesis lauroyl acyltransferase [Microbaculum marinum]|uniref:Lipid A biosynthesis lauroyl acyltransferase n=1 Tax=Microbaculum marinum TaxID=1764581 RepID=A0AAW9RU37_9HYPH
MTPLQRRLFLLKWRIGRVVRPVVDWFVATAAVTVFRLVRMLDIDKASNLGGSIARTFGPLLPVNRLGMDNLRHAFPGKSDAELKSMLREVWDNLGRTAAEYPHLEAIWDWDDDNPGAGRVDATGLDHFRRLRDDGKPAIIFTAHLANWELPAVCAARHGLPVTAVYRTPNNAYVAQRLLKIRRGSMGELLAAGSGQAVAFAMASVLERDAHLGILVDQRLTKGFRNTFFGRTALTNPILGRLARQFDCPVHGVRVVRLPDNRFRLDLTEEIQLPRDESGRIDPEKAMQTINDVVEGWVREHPGQWLWLHNRWRT